MKNKIAFTLVSLLSITIAFAQPKKVLADKIIAVVGNKIILKSDIDNSLLDMQRQGVEVTSDARCMSLATSPTCCFWTSTYPTWTGSASSRC